MIRLATYNVEWFTELFDDAANIMEDDRWSRRHNVTRRQQLAAIGRVMGALDADGIMIIEAPDAHKRRSGTDALEAFAAQYGLRQRRALMGFINQTQQEIAFLYDPDVLTARHDPVGDPAFDQSFQIDLDVDAAPETVRWSKPPLELAVETASGQRLRLIGVHAKSKAPHGATSSADAMRIAIENRRKQLAQCIWLRQRVEAHLEAGEDLVVLGDFNDGPGLDEYEKLFGRSGVEIVIGAPGAPQLYDRHADMVISRTLGAMPASARFWMSEDRRWMSTLLDYVMVSPGLRAKARNWRIWHPFDDAECWQDDVMRDALLTASDHFPVTVDLDL